MRYQHLKKYFLVMNCNFICLVTFFFRLRRLNRVLIHHLSLFQKLHQNTLVHFFLTTYNVIRKILLVFIPCFYQIYF